MTQTFNDVAAGAALGRLARARARDPAIATPAEVCLYAWLAAEAARQHSASVSLSVQQIFQGYTDDQGRVAKVGLALNTIRVGLAHLEQRGFLSVEKIKALRGGGSQMSITVRSE